MAFIHTLSVLQLKFLFAAWVLSVGSPGRVPKLPVDQTMPMRNSLQVKSVLAEPMRSLVVRVNTITSFVHEKRCSGEYCDGYVVLALDDSILYGLICATQMYGDSDSDRSYNASDDAKNCRPVSVEKWAAKTDDKDFFFYSGPDALAAKYQVSSEQKINRGGQN
jgi:hypothetical protein